MANSVRFFILSSLPTQVLEGSFLYLNTDDGDNKVGLYFCDTNGWRYLTNVAQDMSGEVKGAKLFGNKVYFFNSTTLPEKEPTSGYLFNLDLSSLVSGGNGISVTNNAVSVNLASNSIVDGTTTTSEKATNLLVVNSNKELTITDTWDCGEYDNNVMRHVQHLKTQNVGYCRIRKVDIPDDATIVQVSSIPSSPTSSSDKYIQVTSNNWYYCLCGKKPVASSLNFGEISISYAPGFERIFLKNSNGDIVEFEPTDHRENVVVNATFKNDELVPNDGTCSWYIKYGDITDAGINPMGAAVFVRDNTTGKQTVPDVVFDDGNNRLIIYIYSKYNIKAKSYTAIVMGSNYNN